MTEEWVNKYNKKEIEDTDWNVNEPVTKSDADGIGWLLMIIGAVFCVYSIINIITVHHDKIEEKSNIKAGVCKYYGSSIGSVRLISGVLNKGNVDNQMMAISLVSSGLFFKIKIINITTRYETHETFYYDGNIRHSNPSELDDQSNKAYYKIGSTIKSGEFGFVPLEEYNQDGQIYRPRTVVLHITHRLDNDIFVFYANVTSQSSIAGSLTKYALCDKVCLDQEGVEVNEIKHCEEISGCCGGGSCYDDSRLCVLK